MGLHETHMPHSINAWHTGIGQLCRAYDILTGQGAIIAESREFITKQMEKLVALEIENGLSPSQAADLFIILPGPLAEQALTSADLASSRLLDIAGPALEKVTSCPLHTANLSESALDRYKAAGLPYDDLLGDAAAKRWLVRGSAFGETAWRKGHPRKSPAIAYWEHCGMQLPPEGLCPEGASLVATELRKGEAMFTLALKTKIIDSSAVMDWRLVISFLLAQSVLPLMLRKYGNWRRPFPSDLADKLEAIFLPTSSNHMRLEGEARLAHAPSIEAVLLMPKDVPRHIDEILPLTPRCRPTS